MLQRSATWFRSVAVAGAVVALLAVGLMEELQAAHLTQWLHIPLTAIALALIAGGGVVAGVASVEYQAHTHTHK